MWQLFIRDVLFFFFASLYVRRENHINRRNEYVGKQIFFADEKGRKKIPREATFACSKKKNIQKKFSTASRITSRRIFWQRFLKRSLPLIIAAYVPFRHDKLAHFRHIAHSVWSIRRQFPIRYLLEAGGINRNRLHVYKVAVFVLFFFYFCTTLTWSLSLFLVILFSSSCSNVQLNDWCCSGVL